MEIRGKVIKEPEEINQDDCCAYTIAHNDEQYEIVSEGVQAVKDYIFIRNGYDVEVQGNEIVEGTIHTQQSKIKNMNRNHKIAINEEEY